MSNITKRLLDDLLDRVGILGAQAIKAKKAKEIEKQLSEPDEFDEMEEIALWEQELAKHGIDASSYESFTDPSNSERVWMIYSAYCHAREEQQQKEQK